MIQYDTTQTQTQAQTQREIPTHTQELRPQYDTTHTQTHRQRHILTQTYRLTD